MSDMPDLFFPAVNGGRIVRTLLERAADAEAEGDATLAASLFERALLIDESRH